MSEAAEAQDPEVPEIDDHDVGEQLMARTAELLGVPVRVTPDPLSAVVRGAGVVTEDPEPYADFFIDEEDILSEA